MQNTVYFKNLQANSTMNDGLGYDMRNARVGDGDSSSDSSDDAGDNRRSRQQTGTQGQRGQGLNPFGKKYKNTWNADNRDFRCYYTIFILLVIVVGLILGVFLGISLKNSHLGDNHNNDDIDAGDANLNQINNHNMMNDNDMMKNMMNKNNRFNVHGSLSDNENDIGVDGNQLTAESQNIANNLNNNNNILEKPSADVINSKQKTEKPSMKAEEKPSVLAPPPQIPATIVDSAAVAVVDHVAEDDDVLDIKAINMKLLTTYFLQFTDIPLLDKKDTATIFGTNENENTNANANANTAKTAQLFTRIILEDYEIPHIFENAHKFRIRYPHSSSKAKYYRNNEYKRWCFYVYLNAFPSAELSISFNKFDIERGFDRVLVRHFNQTVMDPPVVIAGRGHLSTDARHDSGNNLDYLLPETMYYHVFAHEFQSVCVELESDDSNVDTGLEFDVQIKYDPCRWTEYNACFIEDQSHVHWDRGPFYDGACGIGVQSHQRSAELDGNKNGLFDDMKDDKNKEMLAQSPAFVRCENASAAANPRPEYCLKAPCEHIDNYHNPQGIPGNIRYGWANSSFFFNGFGTLDPQNADLYRMLFADKSTPSIAQRKAPEISASVPKIKQMLKAVQLPSYPFLLTKQTNAELTNKAFDLQSVINALQAKKQEILGEHMAEIVLTAPWVQQAHIDKTKEFLGARLAHSLLIGRPFIFSFTGSSNTAGHDNQFVSTYPMQLQARLRTLWQAIGVTGAAFHVRNTAVGGAPNTVSMAVHTHTRTNEAFLYPFNKASNEFNQANLFGSDIIFWESFMNDGGRPSAAYVEMFLRLTAVENAIFGGMNSLGIKGDCEKVKQTMDKFTAEVEKNHEQFSRSGGFDEWPAKYGEHMGIMYFHFDRFLTVLCPEKRYEELKINWHPNARGHRVEADVYAYSLLSTAIDFLRTHSKDIAAMNAKSVNHLNAFLLSKSGNWADKYIESVAKQDFKLFPKPFYCGAVPFSLCTGIAYFALKTAEPEEYDTAFRMKDYIFNEYYIRPELKTPAEEPEAEADAGVVQTVVEAKAIPIPIPVPVPAMAVAHKFVNGDLSNLAAFGWMYSHSERDPAHYPQDRNGHIGSMDRVKTFQPIPSFFEKLFLEFCSNGTAVNPQMHKVIRDSHSHELAQMVEDFAKATTTDRRGTVHVDRKLMQPYFNISLLIEGFKQYVFERNYGLQIAFLVPEIGNHSFAINTHERGTDIHLFGNLMDLYLQPIEIMDSSGHVVVDMAAKKRTEREKAFDFSKSVMAQRDCVPGMAVCCVSDIPPGKYVLHIVPKNLTADNWSGACVIGNLIGF